MNKTLSYIVGAYGLLSLISIALIFLQANILYSIFGKWTLLVVWVIMPSISAIILVIIGVCGIIKKKAHKEMKKATKKKKR